LFVIDGFDKKSEHATYSYRFTTNEKIRQGLSLNNRQYIRLKISATHSLSNIGKVYEKQYTISDIVSGDFPFGNRLI